MKKSEIKNLEKHIGEISESPIEILENRYFLVDSRTKIVDSHYVVKPIYREKVFAGKCDVAVIVCPHCGELHAHGWARGYRVPHCKRKDKLRGTYFDSDYYIDIEEE